MLPGRKTKHINHRSQHDLQTSNEFNDHGLNMPTFLQKHNKISANNNNIFSPQNNNNNQYKSQGNIKLPQIRQKTQQQQQINSMKTISPTRSIQKQFLETLQKVSINPVSKASLQKIQTNDSSNNLEQQQQEVVPNFVRNRKKELTYTADKLQQYYSPQLKSQQNLKILEQNSQKLMQEIGNNSNNNSTMSKARKSILYLKEIGHQQFSTHNSRRQSRIVNSNNSSQILNNGNNNVSNNNSFVHNHHRKLSYSPQVNISKRNSCSQNLEPIQQQQNSQEDQQEDQQNERKQVRRQGNKKSSFIQYKKKASRSPSIEDIMEKNNLNSNSQVSSQNTQEEIIESRSSIKVQSTNNLNLKDKRSDFINQKLRNSLKNTPYPRNIVFEDEEDNDGQNQKMDNLEVQLYVKELDGGLEQFKQFYVNNIYQKKIQHKNKLIKPVLKPFSLENAQGQRKRGSEITVEKIKIIKEKGGKMVCFFRVVKLYNNEIGYIGNQLIESEIDQMNNNNNNGNSNKKKQKIENLKRDQLLLYPNQLFKVLL